MADGSKGREIEPFSYFPGHASAIIGLGGSELGPDPRYCFHTQYQEYRPGTVLFRIRISDARATVGELGIRVHGYRPNSELEIVLVAGARMPLENLGGEDIESVLRIAAIPDVHYAIYGFFSEASDLRASRLTIFADELGGEEGEDFVSDDTMRSLFGVTVTDSPNRLIADGPPTFARPISQFMTGAQLRSVEYQCDWSDVAGQVHDQVARWEQLFALQTLKTYGFLQNGAGGLVVMNEHRPMTDVLQNRGCLIREVGVQNGVPADPNWAGRKVIDGDELDQISGQFDFLIAITNPWWFRGKDDIFGFTMAALRKVLRGGLAVFVFAADIGTEFQPKPEAESLAYLPRIVDIEQLVLRIIGHGSEVAQLNFSGIDELGAPEGICPFGLIVRR